MLLQGVDVAAQRVWREEDRSWRDEGACPRTCTRARPESYSPERRVGGAHYQQRAALRAVFGGATRGPIPGLKCVVVFQQA